MTRKLAVCLLVATAPAASAQSITPFTLRTSAYRMEMFRHGHFAVNVGGIWMPGCVCLILRTPDGTFPQYEPEHLRELSVTEKRSADAGTLIVIEGMLTDALHFTETISAEERRLTVTYEVQALKDLADTDMYISAGPGPMDMVKGLDYLVATHEGEQRGTYGDDTDLSLSGVTHVTWPGLAHRDVSWAFEQAAEAKVRFTGKACNYEAHLLPDGTLAEGATAKAVCAVQIDFEPGFTGIKPWAEAEVEPVRFDISGASGCVHHVRTDRGNLVEHLNLNEQVEGSNTYQSQAGTSLPGWSGVAELTPAEGEAYRARASGTIVSEWEQTVVARDSAGGPHVEVTYRRDPASKPTDLRLLVYMAQRLEDRGQRFYLRRADGTAVMEAGGIPLTVGMQQELAEGGLGPYTEIGDFGPADEIVIPMLHRGENFALTCNRPAVLSAFRFEIFFRGVWLDFTDDDLSEIKLTMKLERLPQHDGPDWFAPVSEATGAFALSWGGMPVLDRVMLYEGGITEVRDALEGEVASKWTGLVREGDHGLHAEWQRKWPQRRPWLVIDLPGDLAGRAIRFLPPDGPPQQPPRELSHVGTGGGAEDLAAGGTLVISPSALEELRLRPLFDCTMDLYEHKPGDGSRLLLEAVQPTGALGLEVEMATRAGPPMKFDRPDPRATVSGLRAERDGEDVVVTSPWWLVRQSAQADGRPCEIIFFYGSGRNILAGASAAPDVGAPWPDALAPREAARLEIAERSPDRVVVLATGVLPHRRGSVGVPYTATFEYRTGYVNQTWEYDFGEGTEGLTSFTVQYMELRPELDEFLARRMTGRTIRGRALYPCAWVFDEREYARYMCLFDRGVEGIEFLSGPSVAQWRSQLGEPGHAFYGISGCQMFCCPWMDAGKPITISGKKTFEWYMGLANIPPQLDRRYFVCSLQAPTEAMIRHAAYHGLNVIHLSAGVQPGDWRSSDPEGTKQVVSWAHSYGMKIYPFHAHALLHRSVDAVTDDQRLQWGTERLSRTGEREPWVYSAYGDYMCEEAEGWRGHLRGTFARMIQEYGYDGLYYDFVHPILCYNDRHYPDSPHLSSAGMLEMCEWTQRKVGPDGIFSGHTGHVPTIACKNYCTIDTVFEEIGDDQVPSLGRWPEQGQFCNIRPKRLVPSFLTNTCLGPGERKDRPARLQDVRAFVARCALTGVFPPPRTAELEAATLAPDDPSVAPFLALVDAVKAVDLSTMEFADWQHQTAVRADNGHLRAGVYFNPDRALVLIANSESREEQQGNVLIDVTNFGWPAESDLALAALPEGEGRHIGTQELAEAGLPLTLGGYDYYSLLLSRLQGPASTAFCTRAFAEQRTPDVLTIITSGPTSQPGRAVIYCRGAPAGITVDGDSVAIEPPPDWEGWTPISLTFEYETARPVVLELRW